MFHFTAEEKKAILFISALVLLGQGIHYFRKQNCRITVSTAAFAKTIGKIDLNSADKERLVSLPGIGEKLAQRIIEHRDQQGGFADIQELKSIKGITQSRFESIKELIFLE
jgi:competence ComEA-like helix-hairpin-helix protein